MRSKVTASEVRWARSISRMRATSCSSTSEPPAWPCHGATEAATVPTKATTTNAGSIMVVIPSRCSSVSPLFGVTLLPSEPRPLPDAPRDCSREPVPQLPCHHDQLSPMMTLVRGKVAQEVLQVRRKVLPRRPGHMAATGDAQFNEANHALAAARQRQHQLFRSDPTQVDRPRHRHAMSSANAFDPAAPAVVDVGGNHPDGQA